MGSRVVLHQTHPEPLVEVQALHRGGQTEPGTHAPWQGDGFPAAVHASAQLLGLSDGPRVLTHTAAGIVDAHLHLTRTVARHLQRDFACQGTGVGGIRVRGFGLGWLRVRGLVLGWFMVRGLVLGWFRVGG